MRLGASKVKLEIGSKTLLIEISNFQADFWHSVVTNINKMRPKLYLKVKSPILTIIKMSKDGKELAFKMV